jgi:hypothetical protein
MRTARVHLALFMGFALALTAPSAGAQNVVPAGMVACTSPGSLESFLDASDGNDAEAMRQLLRRECRVLRNLTYSLVAVHNGTARILVFKRVGDWESAETLYTLDEMLGTDHSEMIDSPQPLS